MPATIQPGAPAALRWSGALAIVLALHGVAAWLLLTQAIAPISQPPAPEAVMLDLAPDLPPIQPANVEPPAPAAAQTPPTLAPAPAPIPPPPPEPPPPEPPAPDLPAPDLPPLDLPPTPPVAAEVELPVPPPPLPPPPRPQPRPKLKPPVRRVERESPPPAAAVERPFQPAAPSPASTPAPVQAAPQASSRPPAPASVIPSSWRGDLLGRLQRAKRYPDLARSRGDQGVATVSFTMDRAGRVLAVTLVRSSGSALLDEEAAALVRRAEPLPRLPDEIGGATLTLTVPISFALR